MSAREHPWPFATHPRALDRALTQRRLTPHAYAVLVRLYARADRSTWTATLSLDELSDAVGWDQKPDTLYRLLGRLRSDGFLAYSSTPGRKGHRYAIRLLLPPDASEDDPRIEAVADPRTGDAESGSTTGIAGTSQDEPSEDESSLDDKQRPSTGTSHPRTAHASNADPDSDSSDGASVSSEDVETFEKTPRNEDKDTNHVHVEGNTTSERAHVGDGLERFAPDVRAVIEIARSGETSLCRDLLDEVAA